MMEEVQEQKFVCKICSKGFSNGKCMGGHMKGHLAKKTAKKHGNHKVGRNPKTSWRVLNAKQRIPKKENQCKECGKEFPSLRTLSGHMRCHSIKTREEDNKCKQCGKGFDSMRALCGHMRHHSKRSEEINESETLCHIRRKRSRMRYNVNGESSLSHLDESCNVSEIGEVKEAAMCLMIMSRDVRNWVDINCSENFKARTLDINEGGKLVRNADETWRMKKLSKKLGSNVSCFGNSLFGKNETVSGDLGSGFMSKIEKNAALEIPIKWFDVVEDELEKDLLREVRLDQTDTEMTKTNSSDDQDPECGGNTCNENTKANFKIESKEKSPEQENIGKAMRSHKCLICFKVFASGQALGGHKRAHGNGFHEIKTKVSVNKARASS